MFDFIRDVVLFYVRGIFALCFGIGFVLPMWSGHTEEIPILMIYEFLLFIPSLILSIFLMIFRFSFFKTLLVCILLINVFVCWYHFSGRALIATQQSQVSMDETARRLSAESDAWQKRYNSATSNVHEHLHYDNTYTQTEDCSEGCGTQSF